VNKVFTVPEPIAPEILPLTVKAVDEVKVAVITSCTLEDVPIASSQ
jgi:hypothetical protein